MKDHQASKIVNFCNIIESLQLFNLRKITFRKFFCKDFKKFCSVSWRKWDNCRSGLAIDGRYRLQEYTLPKNKRLISNVQVEGLYVIKWGSTIPSVLQIALIITRWLQPIKVITSFIFRYKYLFTLQKLLKLCKIFLKMMY